MDQNWIWRKRSSEKTIISNGDEMQLVPVENDLDTVKETTIQDHEKQAENAMAAKHEAEEEARRLKDELDKAQKDRKKIEDKLSETNKNLSYLTKAILAKEKTNTDLKASVCQKEAELETLMTRLDSTEKENAFLRYEFRSLEKELVHLNEEMECQRLENNRKIMKLESECQRLPASTRKRFGIDQVHGRKSLGVAGNDSGGKKVRDLERENSALKESLVRKEEEITSYRMKVNVFPDHLPPRSWGISELNDHGSIGACSEMRLMDDFVEMEKLTIVAADSSSISNESWIEDMKNMILRQHNMSKTSVEEILGDIKMVLEGNCRNVKVRDEFRKHLGGEGPGTAFGLESVQNLMVEMEKMHSSFHVEIERMRNELDLIRSSEEDKNKIENLEMVILDLDTQLTFTKSELIDLLRRVSQEELLNSGTKTARSSETDMKLENQIAEQPIVDKVMSKTIKQQQRSSLRDQMMYEDNNSPEKKEVVSTTTNENVTSVFSSHPKRADDQAVVFREKGGWGFMKKMMVRRKKHGNKK